jgi:hypothetical protein
MLNDTTNWESWANTPPANTWTPIGKSNGQFKGTFDGKNFVVSGVYINSILERQGFFGYLNGAVKNIGIIASYIKGKNEVGSLVGRNNSSVAKSIDNCYSTSRVAGERYIGVLVGYNEGEINDSYSMGRVAGTDVVGGLVGHHRNNAISNSFSASTILGAGERIGGIAGEHNSGSIIYSYFTGTVSGNREVGGISGAIGSNQGVIRYSYSIGTVSGEVSIGGLTSNNRGKINGCYSASLVTGQTQVGGLVGYQYGGNGAEITGSYYDTERSTQSGGAGISKSNAEMKQKATFTGWDFEDIWGIDSEINNGYPYLLHTKLL